jgi:hypothetical protein
LGQDLLITDLGNIVMDGLAFDQIVDLYNDWLRMTTPEGQEYQAAYLVEYPEGAAEFNAFAGSDTSYDFLVDSTPVVLSREFYKIEFIDSDQLFTGEESYRATGSGTLDSSSTVTAVGHSLGGHLGVAFSRLFNDNCDEVFTVNGAGYMTGVFSGADTSVDSNISYVFNTLSPGSAFPEVKIQNIYGDKFLELTTMDSELFLQQQGGHQEMYIESVAFPHNTIGHGKEQLTDSFAVFDLFARLDSRYESMSAEQFFTELNPVFLAYNNYGDEDATLERVVNSLGKIFVPNYQSLKVGDTSVDRDDLYEKIYAIRENLPATGSTAVEVLSDKTAADIKTQALQNNATGLATRYALVNLNPFIITGNSDQYSQFNSEGELDTAEINNNGQLSLSWVEDRALFLDYAMHGNTSSIRFEDRSHDVLIPGNGQSISSNYIFGSNGADGIRGDVNGDHLYGSSPKAFSPHRAVLPRRAGSRSLAA